MKQIDLHVHSNCSDGTLTPTELVHHAAECRLAAFALTDHDNTDGLTEAMNEALLCQIEVIPGIEFSTEYLGRDIHIVALEPDWQDREFQNRLNFYRAERLRRNQKMIDKMAADGIDISYDKMVASFTETVWTRAHFARYLADHGYVKEMWDAFETHVGDHCKYFVPREKVSPIEITEFIRAFHGIPVLAHPFQYHFSEEELETLLKKLKTAGLIGIEAYYSTHSEDQTNYILSLAGKFDLLPSGGSDFHGSNKPTIALGNGKNNLCIPYELMEHMRQKRDQDDHAPKILSQTAALPDKEDYHEIS